MSVVDEALAQLDERSDHMLLALGDDVVPVSNLSKPLWPGTRGRARPVTKRDLLRYLIRVSPYMLPHLAGRPAFVARFPDGITGESFYQKVWEDRPPFVRTVRIWSNAALDASRLNYPDFLVLDLDAYLYSGREAQGAEPELHRRGFNRVRAAAFEVRRVTTALDLAVYVKTSGRTGLHCYLPIRRRFTFDEVREMAEAIGRFLEGLHPDRVTLAWSVRDRTGKVFVDYNQNIRGKSLAAAFSPRRHRLATVSMPVSWDELVTVYPTDFTIRTVPGLLAERGDPWADILAAKADLDHLFERRPAERGA